MSRAINIRKPKLAELHQLHRILESEATPALRRRAEAVLLHIAGLDAMQIAAALDAHVNTVRADLHAFGRKGVPGILAQGRRGSPRSLTEAQEEALRKVAQEPPSHWGLPWSRWSLSKLRDFVIRRRTVKTISREHLRRVLKKGACAFAESKKRSKAMIHAERQFWPVYAGFGTTCHPEACCSSLM